MMFFIIVLGVLTGIYTMIGGLLAVVWTESIQTVLLLVGAVCITVVGYHYVGGWESLKATLATHPHPLAGAADPKIACNWPTANFLSILRGPSDPSKQPWLGILLGYPGDRHLVLVLRPDDRAARAGRQGRQERPAGPAVLRLPEDPAGVPVRAAGRDLRGPGAAGQPGLRRRGAHAKRNMPTRSWSRTCCRGD